CLLLLVFVFMLPLHLRSTLFPYTTLFRSESWRKMKINFNNNILYKKTSWVCDLQFAKQKTSPYICKYEKETQRHETTGHCYPARSEEHTSELQSRFDLVCRLLLEKKNNIL